MKVVKIYRPVTHGQKSGYIVPLDDWKNTIIAEIEADIDEAKYTNGNLESISIKIIDIDEEEFNNLEEFMGW